MAQLIPAAVFFLAVLALCTLRPGAGRIFLGLFYLVMAIGINVVLVVAAPHQFVALGTAAPLVPPYAWFFEHIVAQSPALFGLLAAAYEVAVGLLLLGRGRWVRWGALGGIVHLLGITPLGVWTLANPVGALALAALLRREYDRSLPEMLAAAVGGLRGRRVAPLLGRGGERPPTGREHVARRGTDAARHG
jgi:hypothetical protein